MMTVAGTYTVSEVSSVSSSVTEADFPTNLLCAPSAMGVQSSNCLGLNSQQEADEQIPFWYVLKALTGAVFRY